MSLRTAASHATMSSPKRQVRDALRFAAVGWLRYDSRNRARRPWRP